MSTFKSKDFKFSNKMKKMLNLKCKLRKEELSLFQIIKEEEITKKVRARVRDLILMIKKISQPYLKHNVYMIYIFIN